MGAFIPPDGLFPCVLWAADEFIGVLHESHGHWLPPPVAWFPPSVPHPHFPGGHVHSPSVHTHLGFPHLEGILSGRGGGQYKLGL